MSVGAKRNLSASDVQMDRNTIVGRGRSAIVFVGTFGNSKVAIKRVMISDLHSQWENQSVDNCFDKITAIQHPNVLKIIGLYDDEHFRYHVMEFCVASLFDYCCHTYTGQVPSQADGLYQMTSGLHYIHSQGFIHRNIKPENVLISQSFQLKISDFGLTMPISARASFSMSSNTRTSPNMQAPEIIQNDEDYSSVAESEAVHNVFSDIFSLGCVLFSFLTRGGHPFLNGGSRHFIAVNIIEGKYNFSGLDEQHFAIPIIERMINKIPEERSKLDQVLKSLEPHISSD